jgi:hypothetical protein
MESIRAAHVHEKHTTQQKLHLHVASVLFVRKEIMRHQPVHPQTTGCVFHAVLITVMLSCMKQLHAHPPATDNVVDNAYLVLILMGKHSTGLGVGMVLQVHVLNVFLVIPGFIAQDVEVYHLA